MGTTQVEIFNIQWGHIAAGGEKNEQRNHGPDIAHEEATQEGLFREEAPGHQL